MSKTIVTKLKNYFDSLVPHIRINIHSYLHLSTIHEFHAHIIPYSLALRIFHQYLCFIPLYPYEHHSLLRKINFRKIEMYCTYHQRLENNDE